MASSLLPNNAQKRLAIIRGTTNNYTLSIFFEASAVLAPDIYGAIRNYIWLCWANRDIEIGEFKKKYEELFSEPKVICDDDVSDWIVEQEDFSRLVGGFNRNVGKHERAWSGYLENTRSAIRSDLNGSGDFLEKLDALQNYSVKGQCINRNQLISALNYIMYVRHYGDIGLIDEDDDDDIENM